MKKKVLILGSSGMIGHQVFNYLFNTDKYEIFNLSYRKKINNETIICNVRNEEKFIKIIVYLKKFTQYP